MEYRYVLRKYIIPHGPMKTAHEARQAWEETKRALPPGDLEVYLVDEFPIQDKPKGWLKSLVKQVTG